MKRILFIGIMLIVCVNLSAKFSFNYKQFFKNRAGRKEYQQEKYAESEENFRANTIENPNVGQFHFNRGTALYKSEQMEEAQNEFIRALNDPNFTEKDKIYHNMGNIAYNSEDYAKALELYRRALIENQNNIDARKNFELAKIMLQQSGGGGDNKEDNSEEQEGQQQQQSQGNQDDQQDEQQQQQQQQMQQDQKTPDQQEAERILQALEQKQEQEREKKTGRGVRSGNWW